jgi:ankyrin repeat protein
LLSKAKAAGSLFVCSPFCITLFSSFACVMRCSRRTTEQLFLATQAGNVQQVVALLDRKATVNITDSNGITPLHHAISLGNEALVQELLKRHADVNAATTQCDPPLHWVAVGGHVRLAHILIEHKADVNCIHDNTALAVATYHKHEALALQLIDSGADFTIETTGYAGGPLLHRAIRAGFKRLVLELLERRADPCALDRWNHSTLGLACSESGNDDIAVALLQHGAQFDHVCGLSPLGFAVINGCQRAAYEMLDRGAHGLDQVPLSIALERGHSQFVLQLIDRRADVNYKYLRETPLHVAARRGDQNLVLELISRQADINICDVCRQPRNSPRANSVLPDDHY